MIKAKLQLIAAVALVLVALPLAVTQQAKAQEAGGPSVVDLSQKTGPTVPAVDNLQDTQRYVMRVTGDNIRLRLTVNGVPLASKVIRQGEVFEMPFNEWLKRDLNIAEVQIEKFNSGMAATADYQLYFQSPTQLVTQEKTVLYQSPASISLPIRHPIGLRVKSIASLRVWQAEKVIFNSLEQQRLIDALNSIRARAIEALTRADNAYLATYDKPVRDEIDKAYGRLPADAEDVIKQRKAIAASLAKLINEPIKSSEPLSAEQLSFNVIGDGNMVQVSRLDGTPVLDVKRGEVGVVLQAPIFGTIAGVWVHLR